jgi:putative endonuclease
VKDKDELGRRGEQLAAEYLERAGLRILDRNWRCETGELDIVALEQRVLVVCEVKTRSGLRYGSPIEAVSQRKRIRLRRLAAAWLAAQDLAFDEVRIDVIGLVGNGPGDFTLEHVRGVG